MRSDLSTLLGSPIGSLIGESESWRFVSLIYLCSSSALGVYDGNVYESLWERVQAEPLNNMEVPPGYQVRRGS